MITFPAGQRRYAVGMLAALAVYYYLRRNGRPSVLRLCVVALVALTVVSAVREVRFAGNNNTSPDPLRWLPWNAAEHLLESGDTSVAPALATEMLVVPSELHYTYGETTLLGPFDHGRSQAAVGRQAGASQRGDPRPRLGGRRPLHVRHPVQHVLAVRGALP